MSNNNAHSFKVVFPLISSGLVNVDLLKFYKWLPIKDKSGKLKIMTQNVSIVLSKIINSVLN